MSELNSIVQAILSDLTKAQHATNRYAARLSRQYQRDSALHGLSVPNVILDEVEFDLRFAVIDKPMAEAEIAAAKTNHSTTWIRETARDLTMIAANNIAERLENQDPGTAEDDAQKKTRLVIQQAITSPKVWNELIPHVVPIFEIALVQRPTGVVVGGDDGEVDAKETRSAAIEWADHTAHRIVDAIGLAICDDLKLANFSFSPNLELEKLEERLVEIFDEIASNETEILRIPSLDVVVDAPSLLDMGKDVVQTLRFKTRMRSFQWTNSSQQHELIAEKS